MGILVWNSSEAFLRKIPRVDSKWGLGIVNPPDWTFTWRAKHVKRTENPRIYIYYSDIKIVVDTTNKPVKINCNNDVVLSVKELEEMNQAITEALEIIQPVATIRDILE